MFAILARMTRYGMQKTDRKKIRFAALAVTIALLTQMPGCFYMQAVRGHMHVMSDRRPIPEVLADEASPQELRNRLMIVQEARNFAVSELLLPDNDSYRTYRDLGRDYVVWNVFAAGEFSLEPRRWCFPVAGCVAYRGYFSEDKARAFATGLADKGFDVAVGGVAAYSTLGRFSDPVLNTMMQWSDIDLVRTIFHELAHQKLYVKDDTAFNESFATAVAAVGIERWIAAHEDSSGQQLVENRASLTEAMMSEVQHTREELTNLYEMQIDEEEKRRRKKALLDALSSAAADLIEGSNSGMKNWLAPPLNNARLVSLGLYRGRQTAFDEILAGCAGRLDCFYSEADALAQLSPAERKTRLDQLAD